MTTYAELEQKHKTAVINTKIEHFFYFQINHKNFLQTQDPDIITMWIFSNTYILGELDKPLVRKLVKKHLMKNLIKQKS